MPIQADDPIRRTSLWLYKADCDAMRQYYGHGWTEKIRQIVHEHCTTVAGHLKTKRTLGDLPHE